MRGMRKYIFLVVTILVPLVISSCITVASPSSDIQQQSMQLTQVAINKQLTQIASDAGSTQSSSTASSYSLGPEYTNEDGGFSFRSISDFGVEMMEGGFTVMSPSGASMDYGPLVTLNSDQIGQGTNLDQAFENVKANLSETPLNFMPAVNVSVDDWDGISADFTAIIEGQNVAGRIVYVNAASQRELLILGIAPVNSWESLAPIFQDVVASVTFLNITAAEPLCGNGICGDFENPGNCPQDCGSPKPEPLCGNGICGDFENPGNCPQDCGSPKPEPLCGNGICGDFENPGNCPQDCN